MTPPNQRPVDQGWQSTTRHLASSLMGRLLRWPMRLWSFVKFPATTSPSRRALLQAQSRSTLRSRVFPKATSLSRRALLQGRLWKLKSPTPIDAPRRLPVQSSPTDKAQPPPRSIAGISIEAVAPTDLQRAAPARTIPVFRPPGAIQESQFLAGCTRCGDCIATCPHQAIRLAPESDSLISARQRIAGTPIVDADLQACLMCADFPCIAVCQPGVLSAANPPIMGTAFITAQLCLAYQHTPCSICSEHCPVENVIRLEDGKPVIAQDSCTGCGVCRQVCPAPENAILLMPALARPQLQI